MADLQNFRSEFVENICFRLEENYRMVAIALDQISEVQLWQKPNTSLNSIGNLILHLCGNLRQYGIASLQNVTDTRDRDREFAISEGSKAELLLRLQTTVEEVKTSIQNTSSQRLVKHTYVQGFDLSGIGNCIHLAEHFSYHTGQIAFWVKILNNQDLGYYSQIDLNIKNEQKPKNPC